MSPATFIIASVLLAATFVNCQNPNYIETQLLCVLDRSPCDSVGQQIKRALPEIIGNNCQACDQSQLANARRIARFVQTRYPDAWVALVQKYSRNNQ